MRPLVLRAAVLAALLAPLLAPVHLGAWPVSAHVHAVTPLSECSVDNAEHSGGRIILDTPAASENGGPVQPGPIPVSTGNAAFGSGGGGAIAEPNCP